MAALTQKRMTRFDTLRTVSIPLASGQTVYQGGKACYDTGALGSVKKAAVSTTLVPLGEFAENADNSAGNSPRVMVKLDREIYAQWYDNVTGANAITTSNLFGSAYFVDDHTVTSASAGASVAGRIWDVDALKGVLVENTALV